MDAEIHAHETLKRGRVPVPFLTDQECELVRSGSREERRRILRNVGQGRCRATPELLISALDSDYWEVRGTAAWLLREVRAAEVVPALIAHVSDPEPQVRGVVVQSLGDLADLQAVPALRKALCDEHAEVRLHALWALLSLKVPWERAELDPLLHDPDPTIRAAAILGLKEQPGIPIVDHLLTALGDESDRVRRAALLSLRPHLTPELTAKVRGFLSDPSMKVRISSAIVLGEIRDKESVPLLLEQYGREGTFVRPSFLIALGRIGDARAIPLLSLALEEPSPPLVVCALWGIGELRVDAVRSRIRELTSSKLRNIRAAALETLGRVGEPEDGATLLAALQDKDPWIRRGGCLGLGHLGFRAATPVLQGLLDDPEPEVQLCAAWALGKTGDAETGALLLGRLARETEARRGHFALGHSSPAVVEEEDVLVGDKAVRIVSDAPELMLDTLLLSIARLSTHNPDSGRVKREVEQILDRLPPGSRAMAIRLPQAERHRKGVVITREDLVQRIGVGAAAARSA